MPMYAFGWVFTVVNCYRIFLAQDEDPGEISSASELLSLLRPIWEALKPNDKMPYVFLTRPALSGASCDALIQVFSLYLKWS